MEYSGFTLCRAHRVLLASLVVSATTGPVAFGRTCERTIGGDDQMRFVDPNAPSEVIRRIEIDADCSTVKLTLKHIGKMPREAMGHNWILTDATWQELVPEALKAGLSAEYVPADKRVIASTKLIGGGQSASVSFSTEKLTRGKDYDFLCGFPAHAATGMNGKLVVKSGKASGH